MTNKGEIGHLYDLIQHRNRWYLNVSAPDIDVFQDIGEKARDYADKRLSKITFLSFYHRFREWDKSDKIIHPEADYFGEFLDSLVWDLGLEGLKSPQKDLYTESVNLKLYFI